MLGASLYLMGNGNEAQNTLRLLAQDHIYPQVSSTPRPMLLPLSKLSAV